MKIRIVWGVFVTTLFLLLLFQAVFLYHTFSLKQEIVHDELNIAFKTALEKELSDRFINSSKLIDANPGKYEKLEYSFSYDDNNRIEKEGLMSLDFQHQQHFLDYVGFPFELFPLDTTFHSLLSEKKISLDYSLVYRDSTDFIESVGNISKSNFSTQPTPIIKGKYVQAFFSIPVPFIFKEMFGLLIVSMLIILIITICLIYETRLIFTQHHMNQLRTDFSHALVHDMKTPLNTIYMAVDQWKRGNLDDKPGLRSKFCDTSMAQVLNLQALVDKILTIARLEEDKILLEKKIVNIPGIIHGLEDKFLLQAKKKVEFKTTIAMIDKEVMADPTYLSNAISNLIDNAIKYSGDSVSILINCHSTTDQLFIEVNDDGFGISPEDQQKIFDKFERGAAIGRKGAKGFGLGLTYVKRVMEAHGGTVSLSSLEGQGCSFVLFIPLTVTSI